jgi:hypothetical protein
MPQTKSFDVTLSATGPHTYAGKITIGLPGAFGDSQTDLDHLGIAFRVDAKWDSNFGKNYDL